MTQSFSLPEPDSELAFNMMPPWKQSDVAFNLLQTSDVQLDSRPGQKRRRDPFNHVHNELQNNNNTMPNERVSNDSEACNNLFGGLDSSFPNDRRGFYSRMLESSTSGIFPFRAPESNSTASVLLSRNFHNADFRNGHQRSLDSAEAATAQAMANFQALIDQGKSSGFQAYNGSSHRPSFAQPNHGSFSSFDLPTVQTSSAFDFFNSGGFQDTNPSGFGDSTGVNGTYRTNSSGFGDTTPVNVGNGTYRTNSSGSLGFGDTTPVNGGYRTNSSVSLGFGDTATGVNGNHIGFQDTNSSQVSLGLGGTGVNGFQDTNSSQVSLGLGGTGVNGFQDTNSSQVSLGLGGTGVNGFQDTNSSQVSLGLGGINAVSETWPNLTCQTSVRNNATSLFAEPQSPCTPRGHRTVLLSEAQEEYLQQMERLNSEALLNSPPHQSSRGRRLSYNEERSSTGVQNNYNVFHPFSELDNQQGENSKHLHVYFDESGIPQHVDHVEENTTVEESATRGSLQFCSTQAEELTTQLEDSFEQAAIAGSEKESNRNHHADQFDLNEVPVVSVGEATPPKTRKKYHPRVAKDKRTYKRRVDGKKTPANPSDGFVNTDSPAKKTAKKRGDNQPTTQLYDEEGRDSSYPEVVDMDIEDMVQTTTNLHTVTQHDTAVCDCEFCIKLRLERRNSTNNFTSNFDSEIPQSPVSPRTFPDSSSNSRRNLFQAPEFSNEASARRLAFDDNEEPALPFDSSPNDSLSLFDDSSPNAMVISQANATAYANVRSFFNARAQASCLQQFNESAAQLGFSWEGKEGAITVAANSSCDWNPPATEIVRSSGCGSNSSTFMSRLCPRGILSPQKIAFRDMNAIQRVVYLKGILSSNAQLTMSPESLLRHVHEHLPDEEKPEFQSSLWPIILKPLTDEQMKQLEDYANAEQPPPQQQQVVEVASLEKVRRKPGPKPKKAKDSMAMTLWPGLVTSTPKPAKATRKYKKKSNAAAAGVVEDSASPNHGLELVPYNNNNNQNNNNSNINNENSNSNTALVAYENKSVVAYEGPFNPVRKRKPRPKVVLDSETVRVWKLLMGKTTNSAEENVNDAEKNELKWEDERRKMKAHALLFIDRMHIVQGDRSFSCWKGSVVDSVVGAFLTQNVNDVLSSSAFMSMRSRFPGRGFRKPPTQTESPNPESEESPSSESVEESPSAPDCPIVTTTLESSQESRNSDSTTTTTNWNQNQSHESSAASEVINQLEDMNLITVPQTGSNSQSENSSGLEYQMELSSNDTNNVNKNKDLVTVENGVLTEVHEPSHGKYNPKTGLTGLERAKIEEKQVTARKSFDFSGLQVEFKPRIAGEMKRKAQPRTEMTEDGVDWEAVRAANVQEVADVIKERGLNWILAGRIKAFLERIHLDYGALDLEWLRSMSTDQTKEFLLSIRGLGLKSVECIRLLTLHHLAFPVDTNVGRICVRLGWVPLEPLPEELQLHLLELYPVQATIQKYLWPRLCKLDQQTLYELHYQMITFGKVFCTKSKPNCNACPMRPECKHFASALSSAKLALPAGERPNNGPTLALPPGTEQEPPQDRGHEPPRPVSQYCQPIVEEPMTPESEADMEEFDMEDYPFTVEEVEPDDLADMNICIQAPTHNPDCCSISDNYVTIPEPLSEPLLEPLSETIMEDWGGLATSGNNSVQLGEESIKIVESVYEEILDLDTDVDNNNSNNNPSEVLIHPNDAASSHEMVLVPHGASLPVPKLKNVGRLRTVHYVYELPDNHPLLDGTSTSRKGGTAEGDAQLDPREHDDPCTYLLAIWSPGEVPESIPNMNDTVDEENPFAASSSEGEESIKATLLVPCRTAMQGSFPLNGTYFQVNEVFADHASSLQPMLVPRTLLWNLRRRFVFFGTSVTSIFRGMTVEEIQACFWRGYVCVRGFDRVTRAPKPLVGRLHLQAGKASGKGANAES